MNERRELGYPPGGRADGVRLASASGRWLLAATALGSGIAFLDTTVVNIALPSIRCDLGGGLAAQQWVVDGYLVTLSALLLPGGVLGDKFGRRRVFSFGLTGFALMSLLCGLAPTPAVLVVARVLQGVFAALLVPGSLAMLNAAIAPSDRGRAVGTWAGLSGVSAAVGPFLGGWFVDAVSWRLVFFINVPLAAVAILITRWWLPERRPERAGALDLAGALLMTAGLIGVVYGLIEIPAGGMADGVPIAVVGVLCLVGFVAVEARAAEPMLPLSVFRSRQFSGVNVATFGIYAALGGSQFLLALQLQESLRYSALEAGAAMLPVTVIMLALSPRMGAFSRRPRLPMTVGPIVAGVGLDLLARATPGHGYVGVILPAVLVFGLGLAITVAPLTATALAAVDEDQVGLASGVNNAVARLAGLLAVAVLPVAAGVRASGSLGPGFSRAMVIAACLCGLGGAVSFATVRSAVPPAQRPTQRPPQPLSPRL